MSSDSPSTQHSKSKEELIQQIYEALYKQIGEEKEQKLLSLATKVACYLEKNESKDEALINGLRGQSRKYYVRMWYDNNKTDWRLGEIIL